MSAPWINKELKQLIRKKKNLRYTNCAAKWLNEVTKKEFNQTKKEVTAKSKHSRKIFEKNLVEEAKNYPRVFFRDANSQKKVKTAIRAMKKQDGTRITNEPAEFAQIINEQYSSFFIIEDNEHTDFREKNQIDISEDDIEYEQIVKLLNNLETDKACGADMIHASLFKNCAKEIAVPITIIFKKSIETSEIPDQWKSANVCPLYKKKETN